MSRPLHEHFDGIGMTFGAPTFTLRYRHHNPQALVRTFNTENGNQLSISVYETTVGVAFLNNYLENLLSPFFKNHTALLLGSGIEFNLYFENPLAFSDYAEFKAQETLSKWASLAGPEGVIDIDI